MFFFREAQADLGFGIWSGLVPIGIMCAKILENKNFDVFLDFCSIFQPYGVSKLIHFPEFHHFSPSQRPIPSWKIRKTSNFLFSSILAHMIPIGTSPDQIPNPRSAWASRKKNHSLLTGQTANPNPPKHTLLHELPDLGVSRNSSKFDRLYLRAQEELEARETCFRKPRTWFKRRKNPIGKIFSQKIVTAG